MGVEMSQIDLQLPGYYKKPRVEQGVGEGETEREQDDKNLQG